MDSKKTVSIDSDHRSRFPLEYAILELLKERFGGELHGGITMGPILSLQIPVTFVTNEWLRSASLAVENGVLACQWWPGSRPETVQLDLSDPNIDIFEWCRKHLERLGIINRLIPAIADSEA